MPLPQQQLLQPTPRTGPEGDPGNKRRANDAPRDEQPKQPSLPESLLTRCTRLVNVNLTRCNQIRTRYLEEMAGRLDRIAKILARWEGGAPHQVELGKFKSQELSTRRPLPVGW